MNANTPPFLKRNDHKRKIFFLGKRDAGVAALHGVVLSGRDLKLGSKRWNFMGSLFFFLAFLRALIPMVMESTPEVLPPPFFLRLFFRLYFLCFITTHDTPTTTTYTNTRHDALCSCIGWSPEGFSSIIFDSPLWVGRKALAWWKARILRPKRARSPITHHRQKGNQ